MTGGVSLVIVFLQGGNNYIAREKAFKRVKVGTFIVTDTKGLSLTGSSFCHAASNQLLFI